MQVEDIHPVEESNGAVVVLGGTGAHPPDGVAWFQWVQAMEEINKRPEARKQAIDLLRNSNGYKSRYVSPNFDFNAFSAIDAQRAIQEALDSKMSIPAASKRIAVPMVPNAVPDPTGIKQGLRKGQKYVRTALKDEFGVPTGSFMEEGVAEKRRDNPANTACASCGSPNNLKACSGCKQRYYCSRTCQRVCRSTLQSLHDLQLNIAPTGTLGTRTQERWYSTKVASLHIPCTNNYTTSLSSSVHIHITVA